jgi:hypothetical protein
MAHNFTFYVVKGFFPQISQILRRNQTTKFCAICILVGEIDHSRAVALNFSSMVAHTNKDYLQIFFGPLCNFYFFSYYFKDFMQFLLLILQ